MSEICLMLDKFRSDWIMECKKGQIVAFSWFLSPQYNLPIFGSSWRGIIIFLISIRFTLKLSCYFVCYIQLINIIHLTDTLYGFVSLTETRNCSLTNFIPVSTNNFLLYFPQNWTKKLQNKRSFTKPVWMHFLCILLATQSRLFMCIFNLCLY